MELRIPLSLRMLPVDKQHPDRVAIVRGPSVLVLEAAYHDPAFRLPTTDEELPDPGRSRCPSSIGSSRQFA